MRQVKASSTNQLNKNKTLNVCPVTFTLGKIGGRWKPIIIYNLLGGTRRYSELRRLIPAITEKMLIQQLKQLEADGLIQRRALPVVPPFVEYSLTNSGIALKNVLEAMVNWANSERGIREWENGRVGEGENEVLGDETMEYWTAHHVNYTFSKTIDMP